jgi:hypothetical protein
MSFAENTNAFGTKDIMYQNLSGMSSDNEFATKAELNVLRESTNDYESECVDVKGNSMNSGTMFDIKAKELKYATMSLRSRVECIEILCFLCVIILGAWIMLLIIHYLLSPINNRSYGIGNIESIELLKNKDMNYVDAKLNITMDIVTDGCGAYSYPCILTTYIGSRYCATWSFGQVVTDKDMKIQKVFEVKSYCASNHIELGGWISVVVYINIPTNIAMYSKQILDIGTRMPYTVK